jgi:hypothetical protein
MKCLCQKNIDFDTHYQNLLTERSIVDHHSEKKAMSTLKIFVTLVILSSAACKNEPGNAQKTSSSDLAEMTIKIGDRVTSKCMIELDKSSVNHKGVRSFSSCIERDYSVSVAFCYVGHYAIMETSGDETKGELIALKLTQTDPRTNHVIFTQTSYILKKVVSTSCFVGLKCSESHTNVVGELYLSYTTTERKTVSETKWYDIQLKEIQNIGVGDYIPRIVMCY